MGIKRPYRRTIRPFLETEEWKYLLHKMYANDPQHYMKAFLLLQNDLLELFSYIEPADQNLETYSHRTQQLLMRACVEVEANFTAILKENGYKSKKKPNNWTMDDYKLVNYSHRLSSYEVRLPEWAGTRGYRKPYEYWNMNSTLPWYKAYNESKHDRQNNFNQATINHLFEAMCGLAVLITAQFWDISYKPGPIGLALEYEGYDSDDGMLSAIGNIFRIRMPTDWPDEEKYDFNWSQLRHLEDPFLNFDHSAYREKL